MATVKGGNTAGPSNVAIDSVSSEDVQRVKMTWGDSTTANRVDTATPLPVGDAGGSLTVDGSVSITGTVAVTDNSGSLTVDNAGTFAVQATSVGTGTNAASQVTVTNSSTSIIASRSGRRGVLLVNNQSVPVYLDPSGGTATTSMFRFDPGASIVLPVTSAVTGITSAAYSASGDAKVHVIELY